MKVLLNEGWPTDTQFEENDPALPGQREWCNLIPRVHRALASFREPVSFPRFRPDFDLPQACAYWEAAYYLVVRLIGWPQDDLGAALRWWYRAGRPTLNDPRLELLKTVWDDQRQLGLLSLWASAHTLWTADELTRWAGEEYGPLRFDEPRVAHLPCLGGSNPLHLGHSLAREDDPTAVLMSPRPAQHRAAILVDSMKTWHGALRRLGETLPADGANHWKVDVIVRPVGWLGTFRRSDVTGTWFQGRHSVHTAWRNG